MAMQRQYNVGLNSVSKSISQAVDKNRYPRLGPLTKNVPERAWPGGQELIRSRRQDDNFKPPPRYMPSYATDVSHLVV